jgi:hypothetical protein
MTPAEELALWQAAQKDLRLYEVRTGKPSSSRLRIIARMAALAVLVAAGGAGAHNWYPVECCSGYDCAPLEAHRVKIVAGGYVIDGKFTVPTKEVRRSQDEHYHACFPQPENLRCFFAPPMGS